MCGVNQERLRWRHWSAYHVQNIREHANRGVIPSQASDPGWRSVVDLLRTRPARAHGSAAPERMVSQRRLEFTFMAQKLFIGGLSFSTPTERLRELFAQIDGVQSVTIVTDRDTGQSRGFGFVEVETTEAANRAVAKLNGVQLDGRALRMEISKPSAPRSGGGYRPRNASGTSRERWYGTHAADV